MRRFIRLSCLQNSVFASSVCALLDTLQVFSTSRALRAYRAGFEGALVPTAMQIGEFLERAIIIKNAKAASQIERAIILKKAAQLTAKAPQIIGVSDEFFVFLKSSEYIFKLFKELCEEKKSIADLRGGDIYAEFDEHLDILEELLNRYLELLEQNGLFDEINRSLKWELNGDFIARFSGIFINIDGILREFEWDVLFAAAKISPLIISFEATKFNQKLINRINQISKTPIKIGFKYELDLASGELLSQTPSPLKNDIYFKSFNNRSAQCGFIFNEISKMIRGDYGVKISPDKIAVILPDEDFGEILKNADFMRMLNFARGDSFSSSRFFRLASRLIDAASSGVLAISGNGDSELGAALCGFGVSEEFYSSFKNRFDFAIGAEDLSALVLDLAEIAGIKAGCKQHQSIMQALLEVRLVLAQNSLKLSDAMRVFLMGLSGARLDDIGGGEVTAMGVLESRGASFDGVIIADFSDEWVPKRSQKELFLSSKVRKRAGLASYADSENLQRFWYSKLISNAKIAVITCTKNDQSSPSRFLNSFNKIDIKVSEEACLRALSGDGASVKIDMDKRPLRAHFDPFLEPLSFTRLDMLLKCERQYFYKYIAKVGARPKLGEADNSAWGTAMHGALASWFKNHPNSFNASEFMQNYFKYPADELRRAIFALDLRAFEEQMKEHFASGWRVVACEEEFKSQIGGVQIKGKIDRVDMGGDRDLMVVDYKSGSVDENSLQLAFYEALVGERFGGYKSCEARFYDFKKFEWVKAKIGTKELIADLDRLKRRFEGGLEHEFLGIDEMIAGALIKTSKSDARRRCAYCDYRIFCKKELK